MVIWLLMDVYIIDPRDGYVSVKKIKINIADMTAK